MILVTLLRTYAGIVPITRCLFMSFRSAIQTNLADMKKGLCSY